MKEKKLSLSGLLVGIFTLVLFLWMLLASFGILNNFWGWDARQAGWGWKLLFIPAGIIIYYMVKSMINYELDASKGNVLVVAVALGLSFAATTGFKFTAGDIKQRVTFINLDGKITDLKGFKKYYGNIYNLDKDTALANYIEKYHELPGVNYWAFNICCALPASTRKPLSMAPRASEEFKWHTGSYEEPLPK